MNCRHCGSQVSFPTFGETIELTGENESHEVRCAICGASIHGVDKEATQPRPNTLPIQYQIPDRFQVDEVLGEGSFGIVSRCWDVKLQRHVAVKIARDAVVRNSMFLREARLASRLQHENIVRVFDVGEYLNQVYIVSEWIDGITLRRWLEKGQRTEEETLRVLIKILDGIDYSHKSGIIHRDLKPGNILVDRVGQPRVLDFGLSQSLDGNNGDLGLGSRAGTPAFMAPEQVSKSGAKVDHRSDVYALGVVLFQLISGELPYSGSVRDVFESIVAVGGPPLLRERKPSVSKALSAICAKAMAKSPDLRYQSAKEFADDLQAYLDGHPIKAYSKFHQRRLARIWRGYWLAAAACGLFAVCGISLLMLYQDYRDANPLPLVTMASEPPDATFLWTRFDPELGLPEEGAVVRSQAGKPKHLTPGFYKVVAFSGRKSVEVYRTVPNSPDAAAGIRVDLGKQIITLKHWSSYVEGNTIALPSIKVVSADRSKTEVAMFPAGSLRITGQELIPVRFAGRLEKVPRFQMDVNEVSWGDIQRTWPQVAIPGGAKSAGPATGLSWDIAVAWCEENGRNLPSVSELVWAATNGGTTFYVNGDEAPKVSNELGKAGKTAAGEIHAWDSTLSKPPVIGLLTGSSEWTCDPFRLLRYDESGELVAMPEHLNPMPKIAGGFPNSVYVLMNLPERIARSPTASANLGNLPVRNEFPNLGFRTVQRFHILE